MDVLEDTAGTQSVVPTSLFGMEPEKSVAVTILVCEHFKGKKNIKWRIHPINVVRHRDGHFYTLYTPPQEDHAELFNSFRKKASMCDGLLSRIQDHLKKSDTNMRAAATSDGMLETLEQTQHTTEAQDRKETQ
jgi:hypothetical protein